MSTITSVPLYSDKRYAITRASASSNRSFQVEDKITGEASQVIVYDDHSLGWDFIGWPKHIKKEMQEIANLIVF